MTDIQQNQRVISETDDEIDLWQYLNIIRSGKWFIIGAVVLAVLIGGIYSVFQPRIYQGDVLLQVEMPRQQILPGMQGLGPGMGKASVEKEILLSRMILGGVVDRYNLAVQAEPVYFPLIGRYLAGRYKDDGPAPVPWFGAKRFAWGGESITVGRLEVAPDLIGQPLILTALEEGYYRISTADRHRLGQGRVDEPLVIRHNGELQVGLFVSELTARPGTEFRLVRMARLSAINKLRGSLSVSQRGRDLGILDVRIEHTDKEHIKSVLDAVTQHYVRQNVERTSEEATRSLKFLDEQLPKIRREVEEAEEVYNLFRSEHQAVDLGAETRALLENVVDVDSKLAEARIEESMLRLGYSPDHPRMLVLAERRKSLEIHRQELEEYISSLPEKEQQALRLRREVEVSTKIYTELLNTSQGLRVVQAGAVGDVRIIDDAVVGSSPVRPRRKLIIALSMVVGGMLGVMIVFGREFFQRGMNDPDILEQRLGRPVYGVIPYSTVQAHSVRQYKRYKVPVVTLAHCKPNEIAVESMRSLRTSLTFALMNQERSVLMISSPGPENGKTFVSVNLGYLLAQNGKHVLVVDTDMRRGKLHRYSQNCRREPGLSNILSGQSTLEQAKTPLLKDTIDLLPSGTIPPNPSELLMRDTFRALMEQWQQDYDVVILDTPPVMAVTDAAIVGAYAGATLLVLRAGKTTVDEAQASIKRLHQANVNVTGLVLNYFHPEKTGASSQYYYYNYDYGNKEHS